MSMAVGMNDTVLLSQAEVAIIVAVRDLKATGYGELRVSVKDGKLTIMATERILLSE